MKLSAMMSREPELIVSAKFFSVTDFWKAQWSEGTQFVKITHGDPLLLLLWELSI